MKNKINLIAGKWFVAAFVCFFAAPVLAQSTPPLAASQTAQLYVISAKAGGVNHVEGDVKIKRAGSSASVQPQVLAKGDEIGEKDRVMTGADGKAEILLNPGSYLRIGENTEIELTSAELEALKIWVERGSALIEANSIGGGKGANISLATAQTGVQFQKAGLYRINATGLTTEIYVWEGLAQVGMQAVKTGRRISVGTGVSAAIVKFDRRVLDALDKWSAERASELAKLNDQLERRELENTLASNFWDNSYISGGYWVFNRRTGTWCYIPYYGASTRCCRAYRQSHNTAIRVKKEESSTAVVVYTPPRKTDDSPVEVITKGSNGSDTGGSSGKTDSDWTPPPSKSDTNSSPSVYTPPPSKSEPPPSPPPPSKSDSDSTPPPSKKDGLR